MLSSVPVNRNHVRAGFDPFRVGLNVIDSRGRWPRLLTQSPAGTVESAMIDYSEKDGRVTFNVRVVPRASRSEIVGEHDGALRVRLAAPPVDGAANEELIRILARAFRLSSASVVIVAGPSSKLKRVAVNGISPEVLLSLKKSE